MKTTGIILFGLGVLSLIVEETFYNYLDADGFLHESLFLPIGAILTILGIALTALSLIRKK